MKKIIKILILVLAILVILITGIFFVVNQKYSKIANYFKPSIEQKVVKVIGDTTCTNNSDCVLAEADCSCNTCQLIPLNVLSAQKNKEYRRKNCDIENKCKFWDCDEVPSDAICIKGQCQKVERTAVTATYKELIDKLKPECAADNDCVLVTKYDGCCPGCDQQAISRIAEIEQQVFLKKNCDEMVICPEYVCTQQPEYYAKCVDSKCKKVECSGEGDAIVLGTMACCNGLKAVGGWPGGYTGDCSLPSPPTGLSICTKCGDGVCNTKTGENKCNCSTDCK